MGHLGAKGFHHFKAAKSILAFQPAGCPAGPIGQKHEQGGSMGDGFVTGDGNNSTKGRMRSLQYPLQG